MIKLYGRYGCRYTTKLRQYLNLLSEQYQYYILDEDFTREEFYNIHPPHKTFPLIMKDGEYLGGCDDYIEQHYNFTDEERKKLNDRLTRITERRLL